MGLPQSPCTTKRNFPIYPPYSLGRKPLLFNICCHMVELVFLIHTPFFPFRLSPFGPIVARLQGPSATTAPMAWCSQSILVSMARPSLISAIRPLLLSRRMWGPRWGVGTKPSSIGGIGLQLERSNLNEYRWRQRHVDGWFGDGC
jgi:hypothetical protein